MEQFKQEEAPRKEHSQAEILAELEPILNDEEKLKEFISARVEELKEKSSRKEIGIFSQTWHEGFINPESPIVRNYMVDPMHIDDDDIYSELAESFRGLKNNEAWKDQTMRAMLYPAIQDAIHKYFGNVGSDQYTDQKNKNHYIDHLDQSDENPGPMSIKGMKGKGIAVCGEKSPTAQNLMSFLGVEAYMVLSSDCKLLPEGEEEAHAYNILHTDKGYFIYDPTNPKVTTDEEKKKVLSYFPSLYPITEEQFQSIKNGMSVTVKHENHTQNDDGVRKSVVSDRIYGGAKKRSL